jgi:diadenosine tetraphosphatase ApaH/serine/threonine PP2A family protein phosphatase
VGEPRHGRKEATYVIYDTEAQDVAMQAVPYDYQKTCAAIIEKGLPPMPEGRNVEMWSYTPALK